MPSNIDNQRRKKAEGLSSEVREKHLLAALKADKEAIEKELYVP